MGSASARPAIDRSRLVVDATLESVSRSRELINDSLRLIAKPHTFVWPIVPARSFEKEAAAIEWFDAERHQRQIDREVRRTARHGFAPSVSAD